MTNGGKPVESSSSTAKKAHTDFSGVITALVTPFKDGLVDFVSLKRLLRFQLDNKIDGFVVHGTTGESPTVTDKEKRQIFEFIQSEVAGQVPLIVGTGTNSTAATVEATQAAEKWGAAAALVVVPYYNKPPQRGLFQHFETVAQSSSLPIILYNVPGRTITRLEIQTIFDLSRYVPRIIGVKEAQGDVAFAQHLIQTCSPDFLVTSGDDGTFLQLIGVGAKGVISVGSHIFPKEFVSWCQRARKGDSEPLREFDRFRELNDYLYIEANPIPIKMALHHMGIIDSPELRLPLTKMAEPLSNNLRNKMQKAGLI